MSERRIKKIFFVAGELSGDRTAAWYINKRFGSTTGHDLVLQGVGGNHMLNVGVELHDRYETLNVTGIIEVIKHIPRLLHYMHSLAAYIKRNNFDEVVLVDFPGFNLRLAKYLKKSMPHLTVIYLSPPQLWCWGSWRLKTIKRYCTHVVVMYPFEVAWYRERGFLNVLWLGSPVYETLQSYIGTALHKEHRIAILMGSRRHEIETMGPRFAACIRQLAEEFPAVSFVIPLASSIDDSYITSLFLHEGLCRYRNRIHLIRGENQKFQSLQTCCCALSKPGTVTLELALLSIPTIIMYKTSWPTYAIARLLVSVSWMGLPNLLMKKEMFPEYLQRHSNPKKVVQAVGKIYSSFATQQASYQELVNNCFAVQNMLVKDQF